MPGLALAPGHFDAGLEPFARLWQMHCSQYGRWEVRRQRASPWSVEVGPEGGGGPRHYMVLMIPGT